MALTVKQQNQLANIMRALRSELMREAEATGYQVMSQRTKEELDRANFRIAENLIPVDKMASYLTYSGTEHKLMKWGG